MAYLLPALSDARVPTALPKRFRGHGYRFRVAALSVTLPDGTFRFAGVIYFKNDLTREYGYTNGFEDRHAEDMTPAVWMKKVVVDEAFRKQFLIDPSEDRDVELMFKRWK